MPFVLMALGAIVVAWNGVNGFLAPEYERIGPAIGEITGLLCFGIGLVWYKLRKIEAAIRGEVPDVQQPKPRELSKLGRVPKRERGLGSACFFCKSCGEDDGSGRMCLRFSTPIPEPAQENPCQGSFWEQRG
jgi:hypothetical protein